MTSLQRVVIRFPFSFVPASTLWRAALGVLALSAFIIVRACGYEFGTVLRYLGYLALYVALPGVVALRWVMGERVTLTAAIALGLPTGFGLEIFTYLGCSALGMRDAYAWAPIGWAVLAVGWCVRRREWLVRAGWTAHHAGLFLAACSCFLGTAWMAASQMFSESPLAGGLPTRAIFHDWVYLVSRAAVIKHNWPLDDPSLSGTPLQYHYFMMVHAAAVSRTTGVELTAVMLRLMYVPLGAVLVAQAWMLGRAVARSPWGGAVAAMLTVVVSELSFAGSYGEPRFLGLFERWLFVSPTFFFGMIFCGALLIAIWRCARIVRCDARHYLWLLLLGTAGTGAKGTVLPVVLAALGLWAGWRCWRERMIPVRIIGFGVCLTAAFLVVYVPTMSAWQTGDAGLRPFHVFELASFWKQHLPAWQQTLAQWLPQTMAAWVASVACAFVVFAGTCGVRLLAIPFLLWRDRSRRDAVLVSWLGAFFVAAAGMGTLMELNSHGELYLLLMMRLPMAVLAAGFVVSAARWIVRTRRDEAKTRAADEPRGFWMRIKLSGIGVGVAIVISGFVVQSGLWWTRNSGGFREFMKTPADLAPDGYMQELREALLWVRANTEPNAVLVANACTPENMKKDHWGALDRTLTGVHFYYSALSERRQWFEGPNYILDTTRARLRASLASNFFYRGGRLSPHVVSADPTYVLLDRSLPDGARVALPAGSRIFSNVRIDIYRLAERPEELAPLEGVRIARGSQP